MAAEHLINVDIARVFETKNKKGFITVLAWGDEVEVLDDTADDHVKVKVTKYVEQADGSIRPRRVEGFIVPPKGIKPSRVVVRKEDSRVLKVDFVDVQQGDGAVIESPKGQVVLVDGGDNQMFARYLANRFRGTTDKKPKKIACILVTHGDADHFLGLTAIHKSETEERLAAQPWKRLFIYPERVYHNGIVKRPGTLDGKSLKDVEMLGETKVVKDPKTKKEITIITGLVEDLTQFDTAQMNKPFKDWRKALDTFVKRGPVKFRALEKGDDAEFDFLAEEGIQVEVLGPLVTEADGHRGLKFLGDPPKGARLGDDVLNVEDDGFKGFSASHTINGHSVVFRLRYGDFNFLFSGDLNDEAGRALTRAHNRGEINLQSEVFKVPHHGSADFSGAFIQAVSPVVSIVSSGDESARKEFIHPRATIMGALGKFGRVEEPLVFVTELVAFFEVVGSVRPECHQFDESGEAVIAGGKAQLDPKAGKRFFAFRRSAFGIVMARTDGKRLLIYTNSGQAQLKEAYAYTINEWGKPEPSKVIQV